MPVTENKKQIDKRFWGILVLLLMVHAAIAFDASRKLTVTHDEYWHLPVGYLALKTGRFDFDTLNPPLIRIWAAFPLLFTSAQTGEIENFKDPGEYGNHFTEANPETYEFYYLLGRCMMILLSVATGLLLAIWACELFGDKTAYLAVFLWAFSPTVLSQATLVTQDLAIAGFFLLTFYIGWHFAKSPGWKWAVLLGVVLGLAQLTKFTAILLVPLLIAQWWIVRFRNREVVATGSVKMIARKWIVLFFISLFVLNAGYLFQGTFDAIHSYSFQSPELKRLHELPEWLQSVPLLIPRDYLTGFDLQRYIMSQVHPCYLNDQWNVTGYRSYYLMALFYKIPHPVQLLIAIAIAGLLLPSLRNGKQNWRIYSVLLLPIVSMLLIASLSKNQLGLRYVSPIMPFLFLFAAQTVDTINLKLHRVVSGLILLSVCLVPFSLRFHPGHLAYFNELAGGPVGGRYHLLDSNLDWGQDLYQVRDYVKQHQLSEIGLVYFGTMRPEIMGINYHLPPEGHPEPGVYAVSVNFVQGRPHVVRDGKGGSHSTDIGAFSYFRFFEPKKHLGQSIDLYELSPADVARWNRAYQQAMQGH